LVRNPDDPIDPGSGRFFVIGRNAARSPDTLKRAINDGHLIGNHTWNHPWLPTKSEKQITDELTQTNTIIQKYTNKPVRYARPPYGAIDNKTYRVYKSLSLSAVFWSVDTRDWADRNASIVCNRVVAGARSGGIVILHDIHQSTVQATQCIIDNLKKRNYSFVTVDELLGEVAEPGHGYNRAE
jgi:peptidoglycan/xylan/chitin deacetylase (PgdA/CDA1 family)